MNIIIGVLIIRFLIWYFYNIVSKNNDIKKLIKRETTRMSERNAKDFLERSEFEMVILNPKELKKVLEHRYPKQMYILNNLNNKRNILNKINILNKKNIDNLDEMLFKKYKEEYDSILEKILPTLFDDLKSHAICLAALDRNKGLKRNYYDFVISIMKKYNLVKKNNKLISVLERMHNDYDYKYILITKELYNNYLKYWDETYKMNKVYNLYGQEFFEKFPVKSVFLYEEIVPYLKVKKMIAYKTKFLCKCDKLKESYILIENIMTKEVKELIIICEDCSANNRYDKIKILDNPIIKNNYINGGNNTNLLDNPIIKNNYINGGNNTNLLDNPFA